MEPSLEPAEEIGVRLQDLTPATVVEGIVPGLAVTVVAVKWHGTTGVTVTYREPDGRVDERLVLKGEEGGIRIRTRGRAWTFDGDGNQFRLAAEARRIQLAHLFDPLLAVHLSQIEPLPHQITAVYRDMLPQQPLRFALCDDPGAGKTIMAGLYIKELALRGDLRRCLVVAPGGLVAQWQDELAERFDMHFRILTRDEIEASRTGNPFDERDLLIARLDHLARNDDLQERLATTDWDLVVVDEAHRMAAHWFGQEVKETRRYRLGRLLGSITRHFLLMTATPHAGKEEDYQLWLALLDADRFEGRFRDGVHAVDTTGLMRRRVKEKLLRFDGRPLFPQRIASTVPYPLSDLEAMLYDEVTTYVTEEMNRADRLADEGEGRRGNRVGFALTVLQRRLASSPEAIYQSLARRKKRLEAQAGELRTRARGVAVRESGELSGLLGDLDRDDDPDKYDDLDDQELEELEELVVDSATAARTVAELEAEIATLGKLENLARKVRAARTDQKWIQLETLLAEAPEMRHRDNSRRKLIVFTEHRDTLNYLLERLRAQLGRKEAVVAIHGGVKREERRAVQARFTNEPDCLILVATDAAGEGINLQRAHLVVNYDLPWNPNRIEQRFGRVHRINQDQVCHMWNLVAEDTREGQVYLTLLHKLDAQRRALGGQVFDVLGEAFRGAPLRDLLIKAIRYGDRPDVRAELERVIDARVGDGLAELVDQHALAADVLDRRAIETIRADMEEAAARRLQPHYVRSFFVDAFRELGGRVKEKEPWRYQISHVPAEVRSRDRLIGTTTPVVTKYERVCFDKDHVRVDGRPPADLLAPGHPLLDATVHLTLERSHHVLKQGAILVDEGDGGTEPRVLLLLEHSVVDGRTESAGTARVVSRRFEFIEIDRAGRATPAGPAPYLDYRPPEQDEADAAAKLAAEAWLAEDFESRAVEVAIEHTVPEHIAHVGNAVMDRVGKTRAAVHERLTREINFWDRRANELAEQVEAGNQPRMNPERAAQRAEELSLRLRARMEELDRESLLRPLTPVVVGAALVLPIGAFDAAGVAVALDGPTRDTKRVEEIAVAAVLAAEATLGRDAKPMPHNNPGYDIRSIEADGHLSFLEVKGRVAGAETVTITRNEILTGLNSERWILALVEVREDDSTEVRYLRHPFQGQIDDLGFRETSRTFKWNDLWEPAGAPS